MPLFTSLVHGAQVHEADIVKSLPLPVGQLSEDAIESAHKEYKTLKQYHSRKTSRINTNTDIFNLMLISLNPVVTNIQKKPRKNQTKFNEVVSGMFRLPSFCAGEGDDDNDYYGDDGYNGDGEKVDNDDVDMDAE